MLRAGKLAAVCEGQADEGEVNDHLPSILSGDPEGVANGFALGEAFKATKAERQVEDKANS